MNILFLTLAYPEGENSSNIYIDLMRNIKSKGHNVYVITSLERRNKRQTVLFKQQGIDVLRVKTGNIQKVNNVEKGISTLLIEGQFINAIKHYFNGIKFDLVIYSTPPITFEKVISYIKKRDNAKSYLLLKDIFPQNAVDMGMIKENSIIHKVFISKEKKLYMISDYIGCMSQANVDYIVKHNSYIARDKVEVCPNSILPKNMKKLDVNEKEELKNKLDIPKNATIVIYGGNIGKPQGINFLIDIIDYYKGKKEIYFLIIGSGTEYKKIEEYININKPSNTKLYSQLSKERYDEIVRISHIGLILLDRRFTIPNFPSRILSYMEYGLPVIAATDINTDIGRCIEKGRFGDWCESGDIEKFNLIIKRYLNDKNLIKEYGINSRRYLEENYIVDKASEIILSHMVNTNINKREELIK